jgi:hypothetical protein
MGTDGGWFLAPPFARPSCYGSSGSPVELSSEFVHDDIVPTVARSKSGGMSRYW